MPGGDEPRDRAQQRRAFLASAIENEIIPQLAFGLRQSARGRAGHAVTRKPRSTPSFDRTEIDRFARMVVADSADAVRVHVDQLLTSGREVETVFLDLLTPVARRLGEMWEQDTCTFVDVTIGLARLHRLMRDCLPGFHSESKTEDANGLSILLSPAPGEQHTFGLAIAAEFFRRAGWDVESEVMISDRDLSRIVGTRALSVVGFSTSCTDRLTPLSETIQHVRRNSRNPDIGVIVGGHVFLQDPRLVAEIGADAMVTDGHQAPLQAQLLVTRLQQSIRR